MMKGIAPKFNQSKTELASKRKSTFIELGVKVKCDDDCDCKKCNKK